MKQLYRIAYERSGSVAGVTFSAADTIAAVEFSEMWEQLCGVRVLTLKPLGASKIQPKAYARTSRPLVGGLESPLPATEVSVNEGLTPAEQFQEEISRRG